MQYVTQANFKIPEKKIQLFLKKLETYKNLGILRIDPNQDEDMVTFITVIPNNNSDWINELKTYAFDLGGDLSSIS